MQIVENACEVVGNRLVIVVESDKLSELNDGQTLKFAAEHTHLFGWPNARINSHDPAAPVDDKGHIPEDFNELVKLANQPNPRYWKRVYFMAKF